MAAFQTVDAYIASFPPAVQATLEAVRQAIRRGAPRTEETIRYGMPAYLLDGRYVVYFAGWKRHVSVYPIPERDPSLAERLAPFTAAKGTLRFPVDEPMPLELIESVAWALLDQRTTSPR